MTALLVAPDPVTAGEAVHRAVGFGRDGYVAEVTVARPDGFATVRGEGLSPEFALARARLAARGKLTARKRATGFNAVGWRSPNYRADFDFGFRAAA